MNLNRLNLRNIACCLIYSTFFTVISSCSESDEPESSLKLLCDDANHVHAVDLGLSVKWACCNVGATAPEESGGLYAWGETEEKSEYSRSTYKWFSEEKDDFAKYCISNEDDDIPIDTVLDPEDDAAHIKMGGKWRTPTREEVDELINRCSWRWATYKGIKGYIVTGPNNNSIFLPANEDYNDWSDGAYWTSSLYNNSHAFGLFFFDGTNGDFDLFCDGEDREAGYGVRAVCSE